MSAAAAEALEAEVLDSAVLRAAAVSVAEAPPPDEVVHALTAIPKRQKRRRVERRQVLHERILRVMRFPNGSILPALREITWRGDAQVLCAPRERRETAMRPKHGVGALLGAAIRRMRSSTRPHRR